MLTEQMKAALREYKYSCVDSSPLSNYVMHPFWNGITQFYPLWLAPNLLTFGGFLLTVAHFLLLTYFNPHFNDGSAVPPWAWLVTAILVFLAHTLDGTDGKQARRTMSSSPLGELFDHGCDSWVCLFLPAALYTMCGENISPLRLFWVQWSLIVIFICSHWEKYITGVLYLPWTFDASQLGVTFTCLAAYMLSHNVCSVQVILGYSTTVVFECLLYGSLIFVQIPMSVYNIRAHCSGTTSWHHGRGVVESFRPWFPLVTLVFSSSCWVYLSPTDLLNKQPRLFIYCMATVASNVCCKLILAQLCKSRAPAINQLVVLYSVFAMWWCTAIPTDWSMRYETLFLWALSTSVTVVHVYEAVAVVNEIANALDVPIFRLKREHYEKLREKSS